MENTDFESIKFDLPKNQSNVIKVIGVGGGGSNAINHMFKQGIKGVDFVICNTDAQALENSPVPNKIQLGVSLTEGLGAGADPAIGQQSALESIEEIEKMLDSNTKMVFITAGMGGGTGTGAAPVIAQLSKEREILTVGIVTIPFQFEGKARQEQALKGVESLRQNVDSLIVINNNKLREVYGNLGFKAGFSKADEVLATASRGIAEVITKHYTQNIDLKDARTVLSNSGTAIMGSASASGENRAKNAVIEALDSPLLNDNKITGAKNVLLLIVFGSNEITIDEIGEISDHIQTEAGNNANIITGIGEDESLGESVSVTIIATGFNKEQQNVIVNSSETKVIIHTLEDDQKVERNLSQNAPKSFAFSTPEKPLKNDVSNVVEEQASGKIIFELEDNDSTKDINVQEGTDIQKKTIVEPISESEGVEASNLDVVFEIVSPEVSAESTISKEEAKVVGIRDIEVKDPVFVVVNASKPVFEQGGFAFDMPKQPAVEQPVLFNLEDDINPIQEITTVDSKSNQSVNDNSDEIIVHSLEDYMELENELNNSKEPVLIKEEEEEFVFSVRRDEEVTNIISDESENYSPLDMPINESSKMLCAEERKKRMKEFNYKFKSSNSHIVDDLEKEPAYKRMGLDLETPIQESNKSRLSLGVDSNNDNQLRSNNSFLHDNVD